jgi:hypothetical protein
MNNISNLYSVFAFSVILRHALTDNVNVGGRNERMRHEYLMKNNGQRDAYPITGIEKTDTGHKPH